MYRSLINKAILLVSIIITAFFIARYGTQSKVFYGDALGYYLYLPATFIYHDLKTPADLPKNKGIGDGIFWYLTQHDEWKTSNSNFIDQYTYGIAFMEMPFFFIAHGYEKIMGLPANGYSETYSILIKISSLFYSLLGLALVYKVLKKYFSNTNSLLATVVLFLGSNLFWFSCYQAGMSHVPLFFLFALLLFLTIRIHERPTFFAFLATGLTAGMITIIRPSDIMCLLIPLLYNVYSKETIHQKILFIKTNSKGIFIFIIAFIIPAIPQFIYWKILTGHFIYYSYGSQSFNWLHPKIIEGLFYFNNGWLPYSPIMIFALVGLLFYKSFRKWAWCIGIILPLYVYVIYSWYCYNYINGFGSRPMIHLYPLLAIPFAAFIQYISGKKIVTKSLVAALFIFLIAVNISYSMQQAKGIIISEESNIKFNLQMLFRMHLTYNDLVVRDAWEWQPDTTKITKTGNLFCENYTDSVSNNYERSNTFSGAFIYHMRHEDYAEGLKVRYDKEKFNGAKWLKCSGLFMYPDYPDYFKHLLVVEIKDKLWRRCKIENKIYTGGINAQTELTHEHSEPNVWGNVYFFVKVPKNIQDGDSIRLFIWNTGHRDLFIKNMCLELYK